MPKLVEAAVWIGKTRTRESYKVYVIGKKPRGIATVWILGSAEARDSGLPNFPPQYGGFPTEDAARLFARKAFPSKEKLEEFLSHDLNPLSLRRTDAPKLVSKVEL